MRATFSSSSTSPRCRSIEASRSSLVALNASKARIMSPCVTDGVRRQACFGFEVGVGVEVHGVLRWIDVKWAADAQARSRDADARWLNEFLQEAASRKQVGCRFRRPSGLRQSTRSTEQLGLQQAEIIAGATASAAIRLHFDKKAEAGPTLYRTSSRRKRIGCLPRQPKGRETNWAGGSRTPCPLNSSISSSTASIGLLMTPRFS